MADERVHQRLAVRAHPHREERLKGAAERRGGEVRPVPEDDSGAAHSGDPFQTRGRCYSDGRGESAVGRTGIFVEQSENFQVNQVKS